MSSALGGRARPVAELSSRGGGQRPSSSSPRNSNKGPKKLRPLGGGGKFPLWPKRHASKNDLLKDDHKDTSAAGVNATTNARADDVGTATTASAFPASAPPPAARKSPRIMFQQVLDLFDADRLIAAMVLLDDVEDRALLDATSDLPGVRDEALEVKRRMQEPEMAAKLNLIRKRGRACEELLNDSVTTDGWSLVSEHGDTKTYFQPVVVNDEKQQRKKYINEYEGDPADLIRIRLEGHVACSPMEQLATIREAQLYKKWMPLCQDSRLLHRKGNADQVVWWKLGVYGLFCFDILMHAFGADCMVEDGSVVIIGNSITTTDRVKEKDLPLPPRGWASWRVSLYDFRVKFKVLSTNASHVMITFVLDPKVRAKELINYAIKKCAALSLSFLRKHAERVVEEKHEHPLTPVMLEDVFYTSFMAPRVLWYVRQNFKNGSPPPILHLLGIDIPKFSTINPYPDHQDPHQGFTSLDHNDPQRKKTADSTAASFPVVSEEAERSEEKNLKLNQLSSSSSHSSSSSTTSLSSFSSFYVADSLHQTKSLDGGQPEQEEEEQEEVKEESKREQQARRHAQRRSITRERTTVAGQVVGRTSHHLWAMNDETVMDMLGIPRGAQSGTLAFVFVAVTLIVLVYGLTVRGYDDLCPL